MSTIGSSTEAGGEMSDSAGRESRNLTLDKKEHAEIEQLAREVAKDFRTSCSKLRSLKPKIERIQGYFADHVRGSVTVLGCGSFKEYCEKKLGRTKQAVYSMLGEYPQRQQNEEGAQTKKAAGLSALAAPDLPANLRALRENFLEAVKRRNSIIRSGCFSCTPARSWRRHRKAA